MYITKLCVWKTRAPLAWSEGTGYNNVYMHCDQVEKWGEKRWDAERGEGKKWVIESFEKFWQGLSMWSVSLRNVWLDKHKMNRYGIR